MKYRKYILIMLLVVFVGLNRVEAGIKNTDCFYVSNQLAVQLESSNGHAYIDRKGWKMLNANKETVLNLRRDHTAKIQYFNDSKNKIISIDYYESFTFPKYSGTNNCPEYLAFYVMDPTWHKTFGGYELYATSSENTILNFKNRISALSSRDSIYYAANIPNMTREEYYKQYMSIRYYDGKELQGKEICNPQTDSNCTEEMVCGEIFGDKNDPNSVMGIINTILLYVRVIVPILIILLGSLDFAKAVVSGKEDEMKKAQITFVKRIVAGVLVFLAPVLVNIIMWLANIVWQGLGLSTC